MGSEEDKKPEIPTKSSMEILSELFSTFQAKPPLIIKKEKSEDSTKTHKKKKKHKHKDRKHKKKDKKRKQSRSGSSSGDSSSREDIEEKVDLAQILIKNEKENAEKKVKLEKKDKDSKQDIHTGDSKVKNEKNKTNESGKKNKIVIKDLKLSTVFEEAAKKIYEKHADHEEGEISESDSHSKHKSKKKHKSHSKKRSRSRSKEHHKSDKKAKTDDNKSSKYRDSSKDKLKSLDKSRDRRKDHSRDRSKDHSRDRSKDHSRGRSKDHSRGRSKDHSRDRTKDHSRDRSKDVSRDDFYGRRKERSRERDSKRDTYRDREHRSRDHHRDEYDRELEEYRRNRSKLKDDDFYNSKEKSSSQREDKWFMRDRYRGYDERDKYKIDKKKLLEIARKNAISMMKSGGLPAALTLGPQAQEKVIAAIKSGGKTIEELTDFCKTLSKKEELGELSSLSEKEETDSDTDKPFHHPFQIKDRPTSITMNIKNSVPLPIKSTVERTSELRIQFPVSSGQQHRKGEDWLPVSPPPSAAKRPEADGGLLAIEAPPPPLVPAPEPQVATVPAPPNAPPGPQVFPTPVNEPSVDIGSIVSQRLTAMRKLQENPNDVQALGQMYKSNKEMQSWASSKQQLGQFTGSTGAYVMSQAELSSGHQAWAKKAILELYKGASRGL